MKAIKKMVLEGKVEFDLLAGPEERIEGLAHAVEQMQMEVQRERPGGYIDVKIMLTGEDGERVNASGLNPYSVMQAHAALIWMKPLR